ncbi:EAL domain-containing protein [Bordetella sp. 2513F-2]
MQDLIEVLNREVHAVVEAFYAALSGLPKSEQILRMLSPDEFAYLKRRQAENLLALAAPELDPQAHAQMALRVGRVHAIVGLDEEELVRSRDALSNALDAVVAPSVSARSLNRYIRRLNTDLAWQLKAYQALQDSRQQVLLELTQLAWSVHRYTDFIQGLVRILAEHDEITRCGICRPDGQGVFHFEAVAPEDKGQALLEMASAPETRFVTAADVPQGQSHIGLAWRNDRVERIVNVATHPQVDPWQQPVRRQGVRSSVAIPLGPQGGKPVAVLVLDSDYPGGFLGPEQVAFVDLLGRLVDGAFMSLSDLDASGAVSHASRMHWATLLRSGGLKMYYQPLLDLRTGTVSKVEALARLVDCDRVCAPGEFLPAFSSDDYFDLYARGLDQALAQRRAWQEHDGLDIAISMNLPTAALDDIRYYEATRTALQAHGCPPARLILEVLEHEELRLAEGRQAIFLRFKELGVQLAQDDLGAGHSGLGSMRRAPFDWAKLDRSMLEIDEPDPTRGLRFVFQLTRLAHALGRKVVAEGVESSDLLDALRALDIDVVQGYVVSMPMPAESLPDWLAAYVSRAPDHRPAGPLHALARFVRWEERLLMNVDASAPPARPGSEAGDGALVQSLLDMDSDMGWPQSPPERAARERLVWALVREGPGSDGFAAAHGALVRLLQARCGTGCPAA